MNFRNKHTGLVWDVDGDLAAQLAADEDYEQVEVETSADNGQENEEANGNQAGDGGADQKAPATNRRRSR